MMTDLVSRLREMQVHNVAQPISTSAANHVTDWLHLGVTEAQFKKENEKKNPTQQ